MSYCNSCNQSSQSSQTNMSLSDFFPAGYRVQAAHPDYPYYISVPVFLSEEEDTDSCGCNCCSSSSSSSNGNYNRIRCTTRFCR